MASTNTASSTERVDGQQPGTSKQDSQESERGGGDANESNDNSSGSFECNICLDTAKDAVVSLCGHLFCWPCLHQWLETHPSNQTCPVCKSAISKDKVIPLYGRGSDSTQDPRGKAPPPRPQGQRTEPDQQYSFMNGFGFGGDGAGGPGPFQFHFGIGAFPFGFFTMMNNGFLGAGNAQLPPELDRQLPDLMRSLLVLIAAIFYWKMIFG